MTNFPTVKSHRARKRDDTMSNHLEPRHVGRDHQLHLLVFKYV